MNIINSFKLKTFFSIIISGNEIVAILIKATKAVPKGTPAAKNPINIGIDEQEQKGVTTPKNTAKK